MPNCSGKSLDYLFKLVNSILLYLLIVYFYMYSFSSLCTQFELSALFGLIDVLQPISMLNILHVYYLEVNFLLRGLIRDNIIIYKCFH